MIPGSIYRALILTVTFALVLSGAPLRADQGTPPTIAIIIDDVGHARHEARRLIALDAPLTLAFLPFLPNTATLAREAHAAGKEIMLHLPMQNSRGLDIGPGGLEMGMPRPQMVAAIRRALGEIPFVRGINNHMGSALTQLREPMSWTMAELSRYPLYFVDSRTTPLTVAQQVAQEHRVPNLARDVFLDHVISREAIHEQFQRLLKIARAKGTAIAIGHPHEATVSYLEDALPRLDEQGIAVATVSALWMIRHNGEEMHGGVAPRAQIEPWSRPVAAVRTRTSARQ